MLGILGTEGRFTGMFGTVTLGMLGLDTLDGRLGLGMFFPKDMRGRLWADATDGEVEAAEVAMFSLSTRE